MLPAKRIAMEKKTENYIRFDWAMKRLLRNKANFDVLEGFLSSLFGMSWKASSPPSLAKPSKSRASWKAKATANERTTRPTVWTYWR